MSTVISVLCRSLARNSAGSRFGAASPIRLLMCGACPIPASSGTDAMHGRPDREFSIHPDDDLLLVQYDGLQLLSSYRDDGRGSLVGRDRTGLRWDLVSSGSYQVTVRPDWRAFKVRCTGPVDMSTLRHEVGRKLGVRPPRAACGSSQSLLCSGRERESRIGAR